MTKTKTKTKITTAQIQSAVMARYLMTGAHVFLGDLMADLGASAEKILSACASEDFNVLCANRTAEFGHDSSTVTCWAIEPTKAALRRMILARGAA